jgi:hypothetical protein
MTAFVANEMSALKKADRVVKHLESQKGGWDVLLQGIGIGAGSEDTRSNNKGDERRDYVGRRGRYTWDKCKEHA